MKVLIGPLNIASQPYLLANGLRKHGIDATSITYVRGDGDALKYKNDWAIDISNTSKSISEIYMDALKESLGHNYDLYHFFQRSFMMSPGQHDKLTGLDIPMLKARGKRIAYRFTGWELIPREGELEQNPYSAMKYGWKGLFDEKYKSAYINFLKQYVDDFMVADIEMQLWMPEATVVPRIVPIENFDEVGIEKKKKPLILHAPTNPEYKGTRFVLQAFEQLKSEGLDFDVKLLNLMPFEEAKEWYKKADIIVDQLHVGWYGVLALECMAMGKPVAVYMREDLVNTPEDVPIENVNPDTLVDRLRIMITDFEYREALAKRSRQYVMDNHDEAVVIPKLINVYKGIMEKPPVMPQNDNFDDIEFLRIQRDLIDQNTSSMSRHDMLRAMLRHLPEPMVHQIRQKRNAMKMMKFNIQNKFKK